MATARNVTRALRSTRTTHALVHTLQRSVQPGEYTCTPRSGAGPSRSAPDCEIKEKRNGEETEKERKEGETRSICKPRRIAYFKTITERFSCPEDDGIALSFVRPAVKNDLRQRSFPLPEFHRAPFLQLLSSSRQVGRNAYRCTLRL